MKGFFFFVPLLGFVAAQMHRDGMNRGQMNGHMNGHMNGGAGMGHPQGDPFFNDFQGTGSKTPPPWAAAPQQGPPFGGNPAMQSQSSTKPPEHNPIPVGGPQVVNTNPHANADPNAQGGNSGGLAGFGEADVFHGILEGNGGAQQRPGGAGGGAGTGQSSGENANGGGGGGMSALVPGLIAGGGGFDANEMQKKSDSNEVYAPGASATTIVGVVVAVLIVIGIFALVAVFLVRQRRQSRVVIGSV